MSDCHEKPRKSLIKEVHYLTIIISIAMKLGTSGR